MEYVYRPNPRIRIRQQDYDEDPHFDDQKQVSEPWLSQYHHDDSVFQRRFWVRFNDTRIDSVDVLWVDEGRLELPWPRRRVENSPPQGRSDYEELSINRYEAAIARIMSGEKLDYKLNEGDIDIRESDFD